MRTIYLKLVWIFLFGVLVFTASAAVAQEAGFKPIFDGRTLDGWKAAEMKYWSVKDGAITARSTEQNPCKSNQFLVWQLGDVDDFELKLKYRIIGTPAANSGIQIRSRVEEAGHAVGYQADIDLAGQYTGALYDERGREMLANRGQKTVIGSDGKMTIIARGNHIILKVNGQITAEVVDNDDGQREMSGVLALQLHAGPPMTVQFKDIQMKRTKLEDRKKIVLVAGPPSHGYGSHAHNAGCLLLAKCLNDNVPNVYTAVYKNGWPKDPTALDNADEVAVYCDGGEGHVVMEHLEEMDALAKKGVGIAMLHYAVEVPKGKPGNYMLDWIGGYFETYWSVNPTWEAKFTDFPKHPITQGVKPFSIRDEWYYHMRFRENMENVTPVLTAIPPDNTRDRPDDAHGGNPTVRAGKGMPEHLGWAYERPNGGRGFGFTGGHDHINWAHNDFRKIVLNGLVWAAGVDVPPDGVPSKTPTTEQLRANMDYPDPGSWNWDRIQEKIDKWNNR
jgi:type 1 glutamine amidotransferase